MHIDLRQVPEARNLLSIAFPDCRVQRAEVRHGVQKMSLRSYWDEGSRSYFEIVRLQDGKALRAPDSHPFFDNVSGVDEFVIPPGFVVVERRYAFGKEFVTFHSPDSSALLAAPVQELSEDEALVVIAAVALKSGYRDEALRKRMSPARIEAARASCRERKLLNARNAVTVEGRNAVEKHPLRYRIY